MMLSQTYYHKVKKIKTQYPDAVFYAVSLGKFQYISSEDWDKTFVWEKALAPSPKLLRDYKANGDWENYVTRFYEEIDNPRSKEAMLKIAREAEVKNVFLVCHCGPKNGKRCHRFLLLDLIKKIANEVGVNVEIIT